LGVRGDPVIHRALRAFAILHRAIKGHNAGIEVTQMIPYARQAELRPVRTMRKVQAGLNSRRTASYAGEDRGALQQDLGENATYSNHGWASLVWNRFLDDSIPRYQRPGHPEPLGPAQLRLDLFS